MLFLRILLLLGIGVSASATFHYIDIVENTSSPFHPDNDPRFNDLTRDNYNRLSSATNPQNWHETEYASALREYAAQNTLFSSHMSDASSNREIYAILSLLFTFAFLLTFLPWAKWTRRADKDLQLAVNITAKTVARGTTAVRNITKPSPIIGRNGITAYSVADELAKWSKLRDENIITEMEFNEARSSLLRRDKA